MKTLTTTGLAAALALGLTTGCRKAASSQAAGGAASAGGTPSISDIMQKVNKRKGGLHADVGDALKADPVDWAAVEPKTKEYAALADFLGKNDPPKGDKSSWESQTKEYAANANGLHAAAEKKDQAAARDAHGKLQRSCMACHKAHKE